MAERGGKRVDIEDVIAVYEFGKSDAVAARKQPDVYERFIDDLEFDRQMAIAWSKGDPASRKPDYWEYWKEREGLEEPVTISNEERVKSSEKAEVTETTEAAKGDNSMSLLDAVKVLYTKGKEVASKLFSMKFFDVAKTPKFMQELGLRGERFTIKYGVISRHIGKDSSHTLTERDWEQLPQALQNPFAISKLTDKKDSYRIYTTLQTESGEFVVVGADVKNAGRDIEINAISTVFGRRNNANLPKNEEVIYKSKEITPEQSSLLERPNFAQYPTEQELSEGKGSKKVVDVQEYVAKWNDNTGEKVQVANSVEEVANTEARAAIEQGVKVKGWYDTRTGEVVVYAPNVKSAEDLVLTIVHENVSHKGLRDTLGEDIYNKMCDKTWEMMDEATRAKYESYAGVNNIKDETKRHRAAADEYIASIAEKVEKEQKLTESERSIWSEVLKTIKEFIVKLYGDVKLTEQDIASIIRVSYDRMRARGDIEANSGAIETAPVVEAPKVENKVRKPSAKSRPVDAKKEISRRLDEEWNDAPSDVKSTIESIANTDEVIDVEDVVYATLAELRRPKTRHKLILQGDGVIKGVTEELGLPAKELQKALGVNAFATRANGGISLQKMAENIVADLDRNITGASNIDVADVRDMLIEAIQSAGEPADISYHRARRRIAMAEKAYNELPKNYFEDIFADEEKLRKDYEQSRTIEARNQRSGEILSGTQLGEQGGIAEGEDGQGIRAEVSDIVSWVQNAEAQRGQANSVAEREIRAKEVDFGKERTRLNTRLEEINSRLTDTRVVDQLQADVNKAIAIYGGAENMPKELYSDLLSRSNAIREETQEFYREKYEIEEQLRVLDKNEETAIKEAEREAKLAEIEKKYSGFLSGKSRVEQGRVDKVLSKPIRYNGVAMTKGQMIEALIDEGVRFEPSSINGKKIYIARTDDNSYYEITKTEYEYARHLGGKTLTQEEAAKAEQKLRYETLRKKYSGLISVKGDLDRRIARLERALKGGNPNNTAGKKMQAELAELRELKDLSEGSARFRVESLVGDEKIFEGMRKLEEGETSHVERVFTENKNFEFTTKNRIESYDDVAYIFKELENEAVENAFVALVKDGKPTVIHLGMGTSTASMVDFISANVAVRRINPDKIYFVHNHPSGMLKASQQDMNILDAMKNAFGENVVQDGIIINTFSGKYGTFGAYGDRESSDIPRDQEEFPIKVHSFSKSVYDRGYKPTPAKSSTDIAAFITSQRLGERPKIGMIVANNQLQIIGNIFLPYSEFTEENADAIANDIAYYTSVMGGNAAFLFGNAKLSEIEGKGLRSKVESRANKQIRLLDYIEVDGGRHKSANDDGVRFRFIGEQGAKSMDKKEGTTARMDNLAVEKKMLSEYSYKEVKMATGWEQGMDGKWRYETPDFEQFDINGNLKFVQRHPDYARYRELVKKNHMAMLLNQDPLTEAEQAELDKLKAKWGGMYGKMDNVDTLDAYVQDDDLFNAYPELKSIRVKLTDELPKGTRGRFVRREADDILILDPEEIQGTIYLNSRYPLREVESTLIHEIQHAIQHIEGFAKGGNSEMINEEEQRKYEGAVEFTKERIESHRQLIHEYLEQQGEISDKMNDWYNRHGDEAEFDAEMRALDEKWDAIDKKIDGVRKRIKEDEQWLEDHNKQDFRLGYDGYRALAGEVEARNVQKRRGMTAEERRNSLAEDTEDVSRADQIFIMDGLGVSEMGSRVDGRMKEVGKHFDGQRLSEEQRAVVDVYSGVRNNLTINVKTKDGNRAIVIRQGTENKAGTKHSLFRHYDTGVGTITAEDIALIPEIIANGAVTEKKRGKSTLNEYKLSKNDVDYTVLTEVDSRREVFADFYTNKKTLTAARSTHSEDARDIAVNVSDGKVSEKTGDLQEGIGEQGAKSMDKKEGTTARMDNLAVAKKMLSEYSYKEVKMATGWEQGMDGKWRYETPDFEQFDINGNLKFVQRHPDYARYRELVKKSKKTIDK